jgi:hypothetical protein
MPVTPVSSHTQKVVGKKDMEKYRRKIQEVKATFGKSKNDHE